MSEAERCLDLKWWADLLEEWPVDSADKALTQWVLDNPNKRPNPGHIVQILKAAWAKHNAPVIQQWEEEQARARLAAIEAEKQAKRLEREALEREKQAREEAKRAESLRLERERRATLTLEERQAEDEQRRLYEGSLGAFLRTHRINLRRVDPPREF